MKGKKVDNVFVSNFISESCANGKFTTNEIAGSALEKIRDIDIKLIEIDNLKKLRSKLCDVLIVFDRNDKACAQLDEALINFYCVKDKRLSQIICDNIFD
jgi:hypothetical protein